MKDINPDHFLWSLDDNGVATVTLNRPERKNPLTFESYAELRDTFRRLNQAPHVKAVVITGAGGNFCSGGDVHDIIGPLIDKDMKGLLEFTRMTGDLVKAMVLIAMGVQPNSAFAGEAGLELSVGNSLAVDRKLKTSDSHIYAAGDITGAHQFTHAAGYEGGIVLSNAIFHLPRKARYTLLPWSTYTDPELASIGLNEKGAGQAGIKYSVWTEEFINNDRSLAEGEKSGKIKMILDENKPYRRGVFCANLRSAK